MNICRNCRYYKPRSWNFRGYERFCEEDSYIEEQLGCYDSHWCSFGWIKAKDPVTGKITAEGIVSAREKNPDGNCPDYEERPPLPPPTPKSAIQRLATLLGWPENA